MHSKNLKRKKKIQQNKMKYNCKKCDFKWEGTSYTFDKVREHEKIHSEDTTSKIARVKIK